MSAYIEIATRAEYWGAASTDAEAEAAAEALMCVLRAGADAMGIDAEIGTSPDGNFENRGNMPESDEQEFMNSLSDFAWQHDRVQAAAFDHRSVDCAAVLRDYDDHVVRMGGASRACLQG